jgi:hypothetical protein
MKFCAGPVLMCLAVQLIPCERDLQDDKWPYGTCTLLKSPTPDAPTFWSKEPSESLKREGAQSQLRAASFSGSALLHLLSLQ